MSIKLGISLGLLNPNAFVNVAEAADEAGFESIWLPEHLVFPIGMSGSPYPQSDHPPIPPSTPLFDVFAYLSFLAARTSRVRLGTNVYLLGLRHPFVAARSIQTLDLVSGGRAEVGIGAGWLREEWQAAGLDPATRGRRLDEALALCKRLWTEETVEHRGEFFEFGPVAFEPKPVQRPHPPIHVGGESDAALRRAARHGNGWLGLAHTPESAAIIASRLSELRATCGRQGEPFEISVIAQPGCREELDAWEDAGVTRLLASPWKRSREAVDGVRRYADGILR